MFTGLVEDIGKIKRITKASISSLLYISSNKIVDDLKIGDSVAVNGVCLTVTSINNDEFSVDVMHETLKRTSLNELTNNSSVNLERAMLVGSRYGGHIVSGHIDGTGKIVSIKQDGIAYIYTIETSPNITKYIIEKGSIAIDGISLTVVSVSKTIFSVSIIPHTLKSTNLGNKKINSIVNLENDCIAKYVEKMLHSGSEDKLKELLKKF